MLSPTDESGAKVIFFSKHTIYPTKKSTSTLFKSYLLFNKRTKFIFFCIFAAMKKTIPIIIFSLLIFLSSCQQKQLQHISGAAFGTIYNVTYLGNASADLPRQIDSVLHELNTTFSIFDSTSLISRINAGENPMVNEDFSKVFSTALEISQQTDGAFDCTIQPLIDLWGFGRNGQKHVVDNVQIDSVKAYMGCKKVHLQGRHIIKEDPRIQLNFNAIAKGYAVDKIADFIQSQGYRDCLVEIGGEIVARGSKNGKDWTVGIQIPTETADGAIDSRESFKLRERAVATSGSYRNFFEQNGTKYTHILNPATGTPEQTNLLSVSVIAPDCVTADAYATAFMVLGLERSLQIIHAHPELEVYFIYDENGKYKVVNSKQKTH